MYCVEILEPCTHGDYWHLEKLALTLLTTLHQTSVFKMARNKSQLSYKIHRPQYTPLVSVTETWLVLVVDKSTTYPPDPWKQWLKAPAGDSRDEEASS